MIIIVLQKDDYNYDYYDNNYGTYTQQIAKRSVADDSTGLGDDTGNTGQNIDDTGNTSGQNVGDSGSAGGLNDGATGNADGQSDGETGNTEGQSSQPAKLLPDEFRGYFK